MKLHILWAFLLLAAVLPGSLLHAQVGNSGLAFLKLGVSGRGEAMGGAMSARVNGAAATYYNPAGLLMPSALGSSSQIMFMHKEWIQDTRVDFLGTSISLDDASAIGFSVNSTSVSDIEIRTRPGEPEGTFAAHNYSVGASYARGLTDDLRAGITMKFLYENILVNESSGIAFDAGIQSATPLEHLTVGAALANIGGMRKLQEETTKLPAMLRVGPAYTEEPGGLVTSVTVAADLLYIFPESRSYLNTGAEVYLTHNIAARAGYQFGSAGRGLSAGVGIEYGMIVLDYAYSRVSADLGDAHTFSLALNL